MPDKPEQLDLRFNQSRDLSSLSEEEIRHRTELAMGEYLARGRKIWPEMPIARILKALERQGISTEEAPGALTLIGASVTQIPDYVAKFNFRVTFPQAVLDRCRQVYEKEDSL